MNRDRYDLSLTTRSDRARPGLATGSELAALALQLHFLEVSESMGNHDSKIVDAGSID